MCIFFCKVQSDTEIIVFSFVKKKRLYLQKVQLYFDITISTNIQNVTLPWPEIEQEIWNKD